MITQLTYNVARFMLLQGLEAAAACVMLIACLMQFFCIIPFWTCRVQQSTSAEYCMRVPRHAYSARLGECAVLL
jgi:hypothetical protein